MSTARIDTRIRVGAWIADPALNLLEQSDRSVRLEPRAMDVLMHLAGRTGVVTSLDELMLAVWKDVVVSDGSVYLAISQLRQALDDAANGASYIETVPKRGYRLTVPVETLAIERAPAPVIQRARRRWTTPALAIGVLAALIALAWSLRPATADDHSLAVLPFADLSPDSDQAYFADGITEEVLNRLATLRDLRVIGRASSFQLRGQGADARALGEKLGVEHVLVGSVRKAGDRVRVTAQLTEARTGQQLWSQTYERRLEDIFAVQDEIAKAVASAMEVKLGVGETALIPGMTRDVAAYDEYLRALALNMVGRRESLPTAIAHLQRAVDIDPNFSMAWSALHAVLSSGAFVVPERATEWRRTAAESLERARQLTPDAPHVLLALGIASMRGGNWLKGAELFQRLEHAQAYCPGVAIGPRGMLLLAVGRIGEAIPALESARAHEPLAPGIAGALSRAYLVNGDYRGAFAEIDRGLQLEGFHELLLNQGFMTALNIGDRREMERRLAVLTDDIPNIRLHRRLAQFLEKPAGVAAEIRDLSATNISSETATLAEWAAYYGEPALALELLAKSMPRPGGPSMIWQPVFDEVRALPGFETLVRSIGIADYWRVHGYADFCKPVNERIQCR